MVIILFDFLYLQNEITLKHIAYSFYGIHVHYIYHNYSTLTIT